MTDISSTPTLTTEHQHDKYDGNRPNPTVVDSTAETDRSFPSSIDATPLSSPDVSAPSSPRHRANLSLGTTDEQALQNSLKEATNLNSADSWKDVQQKTFIRWANFYLRTRNVQVDNISTSFTDGNALNHLLEILSSKKLKKWKFPAKLQIHRLDNLQIAFEFMSNEGVKLVNVRPQEIENGNFKITLGLLWTLISHYQILRFAEQKKKAAEAEARAKEARLAAEKAAKEAEQVVGEDDAGARAAAVEAARIAEHAALEAEKSKLAGSQLSAKADLLLWVNKKLQHYQVPTATDFTSSWTNGLLLMALIDCMETTHTAQVEEFNPEIAKKQLVVVGDSLIDTQSAVDRAEKVLQIPPLMDSYDIVNRPDEQAMMTYIACFRNWEEAVDHLPPAVVPIVESSHTSEIAEVSAADTAAVAVASVADVSGEGEIAPVAEEPVVSPSEGIAVVPAAEEEKEAPIPEVAPLETETLVVPAPLPTVQADEEKSPLENKVPIEEKTAAPEITVGNTAVAPDATPSTPKEVQVCITTPDQRYIHSQKDGSLRWGELNSQWSTWTVTDSNTSDIIYFKDAFGRYMNCNSKGEVYMADQNEESAWKVVRGEFQYFISVNGLYLTPTPSGSVAAIAKPNELSSLTLCFPVVEGMLRKKGRSGLRRWQDRYFAFNGAVMSYWKNREAVRTGSPSGVYYPNKISKVEISKDEPTKFAIHFLDDAVVELEAANQFESARWARALNITSAEKPIDEKRWSVVKS